MFYKEKIYIPICIPVFYPYIFLYIPIFYREKKYVSLYFIPLSLYIYIYPSVFPVVLLWIATLKFSLFHGTGQFVWQEQDFFGALAIIPTDQKHHTIL